MLIKPIGDRRHVLALAAAVIFGAGIVATSQTCCHKGPVEPRIARHAATAIDYGPFMDKLQRHIKRAWFPRKFETSRHGKVFFVFHRDGSISNLHVTVPTNNEESDQAMLAAVKNGAPYHNLPDGSPEAVDIEFSFDYNVHNRNY